MGGGNAPADLVPPFSKIMPPNMPPDSLERGTLIWTLPHNRSRDFIGKKKKAARLWNVAALSVVPGVGIEPTLLSKTDFESVASTNFATRAEFE
jgi:hypothetical protein